jgi:adenine-specific DNA-methyltransferase
MEHRTQFSQVTRTGLYWPGKRTEVERVALPFQVVETINVSRATRDEAPLLAGIQGEEAEQWRNKLIWGENKYIMASLLDQGFAGKIDLIYIDPPFDSGQDFSFLVRVGDEEWVKEPSLIEVKAYRDTWGRGHDLYLQMLYDRLVLMRDLLAPDGSIFVHSDWRVDYLIRSILDEVFGAHRFRNEIAWVYKNAGFKARAQKFHQIHDIIYWYTKSESFAFNPVRERLRRPAKQPLRKWNPESKKADVVRDQQGRIVYKEYDDKLVKSVWEIPMLNVGGERLGFDTQKPRALLRRVIEASSSEGDLIADFFCGSGTTGAVAEELGRRWIMADLSRFAIEVTRKRLLDIADCRPFEITNLGKYERQYWQVHVNGGGPQDHEVLRRYLDFIIGLYRGQGVAGFAHLHGRKAGRMVHIGGVDAPVTLPEINDALDECSANKFRGLDVLGWEWEMGLHDLVTAEARERGVDLRLLTIPREVMDPRAVESGDIEFYELAYLDVAVDRSRVGFQVALKNFVIPNEDLVPQEVREKIKRWSDYVDFWAVDWSYQGDTFHNQWQSYRTRKHPTLRLESDWHSYDAPGKYQVLVKVIDIVGNDTTKLLQVNAG